MRRGEIGLGMGPVNPDIFGDQDFEPARRRVVTNDVAVPDLADRSM